MSSRLISTGVIDQSTDSTSKEATTIEIKGTMDDYAQNVMKTTLLYPVTSVPNAPL